MANGYICIVFILCSVSYIAYIVLCVVFLVWCVILCDVCYFV
jgi:hypothetical protein